LNTKTKNAVAVVAVIAAIFAGWWIIRSDSIEFQVIKGVPVSFQDAYVKIFEEQPRDLWPYEETRRVEFLNLEANRIGIRKWEGGWEYFDIQKVHQFGSDDVYPNALIVFYGPPNDKHVAAHRRQFVRRSNELLDVYQIFTPWGSDVHERVGTYQPVEDYLEILKPLE